MSIAWTSRYALRTKRIRSSEIRELLKITDQPGIISFAGGLPSPDAFPVQRFEGACHKVISEQADHALQYGRTEGYEPLRDWIASNMARYGIRASSMGTSTPSTTSAEPRPVPRPRKSIVPRR